MKKNAKLFGIAAAIAAAALAMAGCDSATGSSNNNINNSPGTPGLVFAGGGGGTYSVIGIADTVRGAVVIPAYHNGRPVTSIWNTAFAHNQWITSVTIGRNVTRIDQGQGGDRMWGELSHNTTTGAFVRTTSLTSVTFEAGSRLEEIGNNAFWGASRLTAIDIPAGVTVIGERAFTSVQLTSVTIPAGVTSIGGHAFTNSSLTSALTTITIPANVNIEEGPLSGATMGRYGAAFSAFYKDPAGNDSAAGTFVFADGAWSRQD